MSERYLETVGSFECVVSKPDSGWFGESREKKNPYIRLWLTVTEGPQAGKKATCDRWLSDAAFDNTVATLAKARGFDGDLNDLYTGKSTLEGRKCNVSTEAEDYRGKTRVKVKWLNPPGGRAAAAPMEEAKVNSPLARLNSRSKAIAKVAMAEAGVTPAIAEADPHDDVPF